MSEKSGILEEQTDFINNLDDDSSIVGGDPRVAEKSSLRNDQT